MAISPCQCLCNSVLCIGFLDRATEIGNSHTDQTQKCKNTKCTVRMHAHTPIWKTERHSAKCIPAPRTFRTLNQALWLSQHNSAAGNIISIAEFWQVDAIRNQIALQRVFIHIINSHLDPSLAHLSLKLRQRQEWNHDLLVDEKKKIEAFGMTFVAIFKKSVLKSPLNNKGKCELQQQFSALLYYTYILHNLKYHPVFFYSGWKSDVCILVMWTLLRMVQYIQNSSIVPLSPW